MTSSLCRRYGKKQLTDMSANLASEDYLADKAKQCPHCNAPIEKNEGCNKVRGGRIWNLDICCSLEFCSPQMVQRLLIREMSV